MTRTQFIIGRLIQISPLIIVTLGYLAGEWWKWRRRQRAEARGFEVIGGK